MHVRLNLKRKSGKYTTVRAIVRIEGKKYTVGTGVKVEVADWDTKRERCKTNSEANQNLEKVRAEIEEHIRATGQPPAKAKTKRTQTTIVDAIQDHLKTKQAQSTSKHTWRAYSTLISNLNRYTAEMARTEKNLDEITNDYLQGFIEWMRQENYSNGHANKMTSTLKAVIRNLLPQEKWRKTKAPQPRPADQIYLTPEEIKLVEKHPIKQKSPLDKTRDVFLAGYYTALRYSDWRKISMARVQLVGTVEVLQITQQKTKNPTTLPLSAPLKRIIEKYPEGLPVTSNQRFNRAVKKLMQTVGLTQTVEITEHRGGKTVSLKFEKWELVSSHTARRSFATNAMLAGIPLTEVMKFTGHKSLQAFMQYIRTTGQEAAVKYAEHPFFK